MELVIFICGLNRRNFIQKKLEGEGFTVKVDHVIRTDFAVKLTVNDIEQAKEVANLIGLDPDRFELTYHET